ncbi:GAF domain-like protein [Syncephalastrum racemosum]|uniref:GAF domain-like protein n=1 Tax=Syncephalastrum racemosum TaxID=13706 RepID=A0A1X2HD49_SYNRA|nr:GAF domain-like protein [Syncephalastrum racemosum]
MFDLAIDPKLSKEDFYVELLEQITAVISGQSNWMTNLANASAVIYHSMRALEHFQRKPINWAGFYLTMEEGKLLLGPFQGKVACTEIKFGHGVCGAAASERVTQVVKDVHAFPGHIACDSASNSEIVVPMILDNRLIGVLDIDCEQVEGFDDRDRAGLEAIVDVLVKGCSWPNVSIFM